MSVCTLRPSSSANNRIPCARQSGADRKFDRNSQVNLFGNVKAWQDTQTQQCAGFAEIYQENLGEYLLCLLKVCHCCVACIFLDCVSKNCIKMRLISLVGK